MSNAHTHLLAAVIGSIAGTVAYWTLAYIAWAIMWWVNLGART